MIRGYPDQTSVFPGVQVAFRVSTDAPQFRVELYRQGAALDLQLTSDWLVGQMKPDHTPDQDWSVDGMVAGRFVPAWPAYPIDLPASLPPGVYIAMFVEGDGSGNERGNTPPLDRSTADAREAKALFVVRNPVAGSCAPILFKLTLLTYQTYNAEGGWSAYQGGPVTLHRPGGGTGGTPYDITVSDPNDKNKPPRQVFGHWEAPFIAWLELNRWSVDYCTDLDIDGDVSGQLLGAYQLLLSVGHDEYWTAPMRDNVERYVANGGNVAFFSGNTCWRQMTFDNPVTIRRSATWWSPDGPNRPENTLTGVSYRNGGGWWGGARDQVGYTVQNLDHWVFNGLQLQDLQVIGNTHRPPVVGYECDGAPISFDPDGHGVPIPDFPSLRTYTPSSFTLLGVARLTHLGNGNSGWLVGDREPNVDQAAGGIYAATMGSDQNNGTVFTAASTDWAPAAASGQEPEIEQITRNVLSKLSGFASVDVTAITGRMVVSPLTSWQTPDGPFIVEHLAGVDASGNVLVFFWSPGAYWQVVDVTAITGRTVVSPLTSWQTPDGPFNVEHLAGVDASGNVLVFFWSPRADWQVVDVTANTGRTVVSPLTSWQTPDGPFNVEHLAGVDASGNVLVFFWSPQADWQVVDVTAIAGRTVVSPLTSWQTPDGPFNVEHLAGVDASGNVLVFFWSPQADWQVVDVTAIAGRMVVSPLTSWQTPDGPFNVEHLAGVDASGNVLVFFWSPQADWQVVDVTAIAGRTVVSPLTSWQTPDGPFNVEHLAGVDASSNVLVFFWSPRADWQVVDVTAITGRTVVSPLTSWQTPDGPFNVEHLAGLSQSSDLVVFYWAWPLD